MNTNQTNTSSSQLYGDMIKKCKAEKGALFTHTRIPDKQLNIFGGIFNINYDEQFWKL